MIIWEYISLSLSERQLLNRIAKNGRSISASEEKNTEKEYIHCISVSLYLRRCKQLQKRKGNFPGKGKICLNCVGESDNLTGGGKIFSVYFSHKELIFLEKLNWLQRVKNPSKRVPKYIIVMKSNSFPICS
jgi:hypothetical protein